MEEVSSLESFATDDGVVETAGNSIEEEQQQHEEEETSENQTQMEPTPADAADNVDESLEKDTAKAVADDEFEQVSDGDFEADDSQNALIDAPEIAEQQQQAETETESRENAAEEELNSMDDLFEEDEATAQTNESIFEEVDAHVSGNANSTLGDETDALGLQDNTLPMDNNEQASATAVAAAAADTSDDTKNVETMEVDDTSVVEQTSAKDVEMASLSNSPADAEIAKAADEQATETTANPTATTTQDNKEKETSMDIEAETWEKTNDNTTDDGGIDVLDNRTVEDEVEDKTNTPTETNADEEDNAEHGDEPIEHVEEPLESDICLVPDDTENEVTDAEKEQAILARENAEKETDGKQQEEEEEATNNDETNADADKAQQSANNDVAATTTAVIATSDDADKAAVTTAEETPDPDESLLEEMQPSTDSTSKIIIGWIVSSQQRCTQCGVTKMCGYRLKNPDNNSELEYICDQACCDAMLSVFPGKYFIRRKKFLIEELSTDEANSPEHACLQCKETKACKYFFKQDNDNFYVCNDACYNVLNAEEPDKFKLKRHSIRVRNIGATTLTSKTTTTTQVADTRVVARTAAEAEAARLERLTSFTRRCADCAQEVTLGDKNLLWETMDFCNEICLGKYQRAIGASCQTCHGEVPHQALGKYCVRFGFDIRQFCCASCLNEFKKGLKTCSCCQKDISSGTEGFLAPVGDKEQFKDFCSQACMRRYDNMCNPKKKLRSDTCAVCKNDKPVRVEILLDNEQHNFCSNPCFSAFKFVGNIVADQCGMCCKYFERKGAESFTIYTERRAKVFCSRICLNVYIIVNRRIVSCQWCKVKKYNFDMIYKQQDAQEVLMCSLNCLTLYGVSINAFSRTVAKCDNCSNSATPQYHLTMSDASMRNFCTYQCVMQFQSQFARTPLTLENEPTAAAQTPTAQQQQQQSALQTNKSTTTMMKVGAATAPYPTGIPKRVKLKMNQTSAMTATAAAKKTPAKKTAAATVATSQTMQDGSKKNASNTTTLPIISTVSSLASGETETMLGNISIRRGRGRGRGKADSPTPVPALAPLSNNNASAGGARGRTRRMVDYAQRSPSPAASLSPPRTSITSKRSNAAATATTATAALATEVHTETKIIAVPPYPPMVRNVASNVKPQQESIGCQSEPEMRTTATQTGKDYSNKVLIPVPVPIYIPQPMYMYSAPFPVPVPIPLPIPVPIFIPTTRNSAQGILKEIKKIQDKMPADPFEAELLMMAEMVAEEKHESDSDSDDEIKPDPSAMSINYTNNVHADENNYQDDVLQMAIKMASGEYDQPSSTVDLESAMTTNTITNPPPGMVDDGMLSAHHMQQQHQLIETRAPRGRKRGSTAAATAARASRSPVKRQRLQEIETPQVQAAAAVTPQPLQPIEKPDANMCLKYTFGVNAWKQWVVTKNADIEKSSVRRRTFKTDLLQMTADELNYSLCLFVKEVRKPNGTEYAPDTIYYLVLGIQQYLYENGRIDNIFTDPYYERFTDCLDEVARKFSVLYNDSQYIVTRVEEEHLWESKQLGAHSPHVLLSTLMFFNTKHFNLTTVEEHMQLSFSHIMKHWKRTPQSAKNASTRNVLLRFYPPQAGLDANPRKKKVYEQQENEENPLRCPVRLYEFYLSKCPESVKTRNDVFYLQPERSCVPDSPVWYSTQALSQEALQKMLHRVKMVKEINIALLTS